jgi:hypothetical protein
MAHCRLVFETGVGNAKRELFQASFNISRVMGLGKPEREIQQLIDELQKGLRMLALLSSLAAA